MSSTHAIDHLTLIGRDCSAEVNPDRNAISNKLSSAGD